MSFNEHYSGQYNAQYSTFQYNYNHQFGLHYNPVPVENKIISDEEFVAQWNERIKHRVVSKSQNKKASIQQAREKLSKLILLIDEIKIHEKTLTDNISTMSNAEWNDKFNDINAKKTEVNAIMSALNDSYLDSLRVSLAKRSAKRLRLKKLKLRRAEARQQALKERDEKIRRIDENLQKMKDELERNKREEEYKRQADIFLRDVFRKKHDAKKCIAKLEALMKLRKARATTALGRGERVSESGGKMFNENMEKLIALWRHKLAGYEKEELELNLKLKAKSQDSSQGETAHNTVNTLSMWREAMFGSTDAMPQRDFNGNLAGFIAVRHKWDEYISEGGTPIPVGWLLPQELSYELP